MAARPLAARALAALLAGALLSAASLEGCRERPASTPRDEPVAPAGIADVSREVAGDSATALTDRGRCAEALPYIRRIEQLDPRLPPAYDAAIGAVCNDAALESRLLRGVPMPAVRSTAERVALGREGLARLDRALERTTSAADSSRFLAIRAQSLAMWGFSREAVLTWRRADRCLRLSGRTRQQAALVETWLRDPLPAAPPRAPR